MEFCENILHILVDWGILLFETAGVVILLTGLFKGIIQCIKKDPLARLHLSKSMALALNFKLGGEILRTVTIRKMDECLFVGIIILLRAAMAFLINWEIKNETAEHVHQDHFDKEHQNSD